VDDDKMKILSKMRSKYLMDTLPDEDNETKML